MSDVQVPELRPMGLGDILDATFKLYQRNFATFLTIALVMYLPYAALAAMFPLVIQTLVGDAENPDAAAVAATLTAVLLFLIATYIMIPLCTSALVHNISATYLGEQLSARESYRRAWPRLGRLILAWFIGGIIIVIGFLLLIVPGIIFSLWFYVLTPIILLEEHTATSALQRSRELMRDNLGKAFLLGIVVNLLSAFLSGGMGFVVALIPWPLDWMETFVSTTANALLVPIQTAPVILLYYDLRIRKEAFDLEHLSTMLATEPGAAT